MASRSISCNGVKQRCLRTGCYWLLLERTKEKRDRWGNGSNTENCRSVGREELKRHVEEKKLFGWEAGGENSVRGKR